MEQHPKPHNYLHRRGGPRDRGGLRFQILAYALGQTDFTPKRSVAAVTRSVTRLWIRRLDKPSPVPYYDVSSCRLQAQLWGYLSTQSYVGLEFSVRAWGWAPSKQLGLNVKPMVSE